MEGNNGQDAGTAPPFQMSRHSHPKARPGLIDTAHRSELADKVNYAALGDIPAVVDLTDLTGE